MVTCYKCKQPKEECEFTRTKLQGMRNRFAPYCKECMKEYSSSWWKNNKELAKTYYDNKKKCAKVRLRLLLRCGNKKIDRSAIDFDWAWNRLEANNFSCEITGIPFSYESRSPHALSVDRIDSSKGYTKDNVRFVCWWINAAMGNWGLDKLEELIEEWKKNKINSERV